MPVTATAKLKVPLIQLVEWAKEPTEVDGFRNREEAEAWKRELERAEDRIKEQLRIPEPLFLVEYSWHPDAGSQLLLRARRVVGWFTVGRRVVAVLPKFIAAGSPEASGVLFAQLLEYSRSGRFHTYEWVKGDPSLRTPVDLLARAFLRAVELAFSQGLPRGYSSQEREEHILRGRLRIPQLYPGALVRPHVLPQEIDEFVTDIPLSRLLRWTSTALSEVASDGLLRARLAEASTRLTDVPPILPPEQVVAHLRLPPTLSHYQEALDLARLFAQGRLIAPGREGPDVLGFVFVGWHVFQEYAGRLLHEAVRRLPAGLAVRHQTSWVLATSLESGRPLRRHPDFVLLDDARTLAVMDAKYKAPLGAKDLPEDDNVNQVIATARAIGAPRAILLQPQEFDAVGPRRRRWRVLGAGAPESIEMLFLRPATLRAQADHVREVEWLANELQGFR
jgi:hypothetical protein